MRHFTSVSDVENIDDLIQTALEYKQQPCSEPSLGAGKTIGLIFFNPSMRTLMSTQCAAHNLGMKVIVLTANNDSWGIEFTDGTVMDSGPSEHISEAAAVMSQYCDIIGVRSFAGLKNRCDDEEEHILNQFIKYATVPLISMESATRHPLQSLADMMTIHELSQKKHPKIVLAWAPHIKALPQAVPNSFSEWSLASGHALTIVQPFGFELKESFTRGATISYDYRSALKGADFVYVKNWSSYHDYGKAGDFKEWMFDKEKLALTNDARVMHCLPVRRNVVIHDEVLNSNQSVVIQQAGNRLWTAQAVLSKILKSL